MLRKFALSLLIMSVALLGVAADKKKGKGGTTSTTTVATSTADIKASEGSTAMAIRGIVEPVDGAVVIGFTDGVFIARDRVTGRIVKFTAPAGSFTVGTAVKIDFSGKMVQTSAGRFEISNAAPCCNIAAINSGDHTITVKEPAVGRFFVMKVEPTHDVKLGQAVEANFKTGQAWISGNSALKCAISNLSQATGLHP